MEEIKRKIMWTGALALFFLICAIGAFVFFDITLDIISNAVRAYGG